MQNDHDFISEVIYKFIILLRVKVDLSDLRLNSTQNLRLLNNPVLKQDCYLLTDKILDFSTISISFVIG